MNEPRGWFITGTDTEIGKTFVACALLHALRRTGLSALAMKPVAAGFDENGFNDDVERLLAASSSSHRGRWSIPTASAPRLRRTSPPRRKAGHRAGAHRRAFAQLQAMADAVLVEGVGGFCVPLGASCDTADLAALLKLPLILVVGMRLGCINHALLTQQAIAARGLPLAGWVANRIDPAMSRFAENLAALQARLPAPLLGVVEYGTTPEQAALTLRLPDQPLPAINQMRFPG
jgi:dethiobiotin synthetase